MYIATTKSRLNHLLSIQFSSADVYQLHSEIIENSSERVHSRCTQYTRGQIVMTLASGGEIKAVREMDEEKLPEREREIIYTGAR